MASSRRNRLATVLIVVGLLFAITVFLMPFLFDWKPMFFDDIAFAYYPPCYYLAQCFQSGVFPFWDPHIAAGASPFFARLYVSTYNLVLLPFLLLVRLGDPQHFLLMIVKLPLLLHYLLATFWTFILARWGLRLNLAGSTAMTLTYLFSPMMIFYVTFPPAIYVYSMLPALILWALLFARDGRVSYLIPGVLVFALFSPAGEVMSVIHVSTIALLVGLFAAVGWIVRKKYRTALRFIGGVAIIIVIGGLLAGLYWGNIWAGLELLQATPMMDREAALGRDYSVPPPFLATLLVPDWFGTVTCAHTWGPPYQVKFTINDAQMTGGVTLLFISLLGLIMAAKDPRRTEIALWVRIFSALTGFGILVVLGRYFPFYRLVQIFPVFKWLPYPLRWRVIQCFAVSGLVGSSVSLLWSRRENIARIWTLGLTVLFLAGSILVLLVASLWPFSAQGAHYSTGISHLRVLGDQKWFLTGPVLYFLIAGIFLLLISRFRTNLRVYLLSALIAVELVWFAVPAFYENQILNYRLKDLYRDLSVERFYSPEDQPAYLLGREWEREGPEKIGMYRQTYFRSNLDHTDWVNQSLSMLGLDLKPLLPRFQKMIEEMTTGLPYELRPQKLDSWFWPNMSVRHLILEKPISSPLLKFRGKLGDFYTYESTGVLPRFYFQDRWAIAEEEKQQIALRDYDLRAAGYCEKEMWERRPFPKKLPDAEPLSEEEWIRHFNSMQEKNKIISTDFSNPNRVVLEVDVNKPCMLVMTDVWHPDWKVIVDGEGENFYRVNYLQRGVWCPPGQYSIIMEFLPSSLKRGITMTALGLLGLAWLILASFRRASRRPRT